MTGRRAAAIAAACVLLLTGAKGCPGSGTDPACPGLRGDLAAADRRMEAADYGSAAYRKARAEYLRVSAQLRHHAC